MATRPQPLGALLRGILGGIPHQLGPLGLYVRREDVEPEIFPLLESLLLERGSLRVLDFQMGRVEDLEENIVPREGSDPAAYRGAPRPPHRVFRVDHHHPIPDLRGQSTTPMMLAWLLTLHAAGETELLAQVAGARYLADHADPDILLAHHLALQARRRDYLEGPMGPWLAAAALRNDYIRLPPAELEPQASRIFYATLGIEEAIEDGEIPWEDAQTRWLPGLEAWLAGGDAMDPEIRRWLDRWEAERRWHEQATLDRIGLWRDAGCWREAAGGRLVFLDAPKKIDNAEFYLYVVSRLPPERRPAVQLLRFPVEGGESWMYKLRSHGSFDLTPLYARLNEILEGIRFGGRAAAGGSRVSAVPPEAVLSVLVEEMEGDPS